MEYTLEIKSKNGVKEIYFDFSNSNRRAAIAMLEDVLKPLKHIDVKALLLRRTIGRRALRIVKQGN